jgi:hypothetical protein
MWWEHNMPEGLCRDKTLIATVSTEITDMGFSLIWEKRLNWETLNGGSTVFHLCEKHIVTCTNFKMTTLPLLSLPIVGK